MVGIGTESVLVEAIDEAEVKGIMGTNNIIDRMRIDGTTSCLLGFSLVKGLARKLDEATKEVGQVHDNIVVLAKTVWSANG